MSGMTERKAYGSAWRPNAAGRKLFLSCLSVCSFLLFLLSSSRTRGSRFFLLLHASGPPQNPGFPINNVRRKAYGSAWNRTLDSRTRGSAWNRTLDSRLKMSGMTERKAYGSAWRPNAARRKSFLSCPSCFSFLLFLLSSSRTRGSRVFSAPPCVRVRLEQNPGFPINTGSPIRSSITNVEDRRRGQASGMTERKACGSAWNRTLDSRLTMSGMTERKAYGSAWNRTLDSRLKMSGMTERKAWRVRLEQNPGFPIENVGNDREESVRVRLQIEQNPGFPINTGSPIRSSITNVEDRRRGQASGMTERKKRE